MWDENGNRISPEKITPGIDDEWQTEIDQDLAKSLDLSPDVGEEDTAEVSLFMVMLSMFAVMMFIMWLMLRRC